MLLVPAQHSVDGFGARLIVRGGRARGAVPIHPAVGRFHPEVRPVGSQLGALLRCFVENGSTWGVPPSFFRVDGTRDATQLFHDRKQRACVVCSCPDLKEVGPTWEVSYRHVALVRTDSSPGVMHGQYGAAKHVVHKEVYLRGFAKDIANGCTLR